MAEYVFVKPYVFEGKTYEKIEFDLEGLKGSDISAVKKQWSASGNNSPLPVADSDFCAMIVARLIKQPFEFMMEMPGKDYNRITMQVMNFLLA